MGLLLHGINPSIVYKSIYKCNVIFAPITWSYMCKAPDTSEKTSSNGACVLLIVVGNVNCFALPKGQTLQKLNSFWSLDLMPSLSSNRDRVLLHGWPSLWCHKWPTLVLESSTQLVDLVLFTCRLYSTNEGVVGCLLMVDGVVARWGRNTFTPLEKLANSRLDGILEIFSWRKPSLRLP